MKAWSEVAATSASDLIKLVHELNGAELDPVERDRLQRVLVATSVNLWELSHGLERAHASTVRIPPS